MPATNRGRYIAHLEGFWPIGFIVSGPLSLTMLSVASWRWVFILENLPAIWVLVVRRCVPGFPAATWLVELWRRKGTCMATLLGSAAACYFYGAARSKAQLIAFGQCIRFRLFGIWSVLYAYAPELYPTRIRATGGGFASAVGRLGSLFGPQVVGVVLPAAGTAGVFSLGAGGNLAVIGGGMEKA